MKRSEMLKKLEDIFRRYEDPAGIADKALYVVEREGMLPPMLPIPEYAFQADHAWEPEDETK